MNPPPLLMITCVCGNINGFPVNLINEIRVKFQYLDYITQFFFFFLLLCIKVIYAHNAITVILWERAAQYIILLLSTESQFAIRPHTESFLWGIIGLLEAFYPFVLPPTVQGQTSAGSA